jgi:nicotinamidase/pyrazinamidase
MPRAADLGAGPRTALIVVDPQVDFVEGGALGVTGGEAALSRIAEHLRLDHASYGARCLTRDWHVAPGPHFASTTRSAPDFVDTWPDHCVAGTAGADVHPAAAPEIDKYVDAEFRKGERAAAYSAFEAVLASDGSTTLDEWLHERRIDRLVVAGLATDYCVRATALDGLARGYEVVIPVVMCAGVHPESSEAALREAAAAGAEVIDSSDVT